MPMSRFTLLASCWARWLVNTAVSAACYTALAAFLLPGFLTATAWPWNATGIGTLSAISAAAILYAQQPLRLAYLTALDGLTREQRAQAITAVHRDSIPNDPAVLASAVRMGALGMSYVNRLIKSNPAVRWFATGAYVLAAVAQFFSQHPTRALMWLGFAVYYATYFSILLRRQRRLPARVESLRTAGAGLTQVEAALCDTARGVQRPPQRGWVAVVLGVVVLGYSVAAQMTGLAH